MKIMKKCISLVVVGLVILCGIEAVALPLNQVDTSFEKSPQTPCSLPTNTTNLTIIIKGGIGVIVIFTNTGKFNAINVSTEINITNGPFHFYSVGAGGLYLVPLSPGKSYRERVSDIGLGTITVDVTAQADNAAQVTKTAKGFILLFFVIIS
jgi:hypothetical protein